MVFCRINSAAGGGWCAVFRSQRGEVHTLGGPELRVQSLFEPTTLGAGTLGAAHRSGTRRPLRGTRHHRRCRAGRRAGAAPP